MIALKYYPDLNLNDNQIISYSIISVIVAYLLQQQLYEGMEPTVSICDNEVVIPNKYELKSPDEDMLMSGYNYNYNNPNHPLLQHGQFEEILATSDDVKSSLASQRYNTATETPGYYLINNGKLSNGISFDQVQQLIDNSKFKSLYNQHNLNIPFSPHTHLGKDRGYLNWATGGNFF
jgi:hypothetical protein